MKTAVVYYSYSGNCRYVADKIARQINADLIGLETVDSYPDKRAKNFYFGGKSALMGETPKLKPYEFKASDYDLIIIGLPVWAASITPPINTFLKENNLKGKKIAGYACCSIGGTERVLNKLESELGTKLVARLGLKDPKDRQSAGNDEKINEFCKKLGV